MSNKYKKQKYEHAFRLLQRANELLDEDYAAHVEKISSTETI